MIDILNYHEFHDVSCLVAIMVKFTKPSYLWWSAMVCGNLIAIECKTKRKCVENKELICIVCEIWIKKLPKNINVY